MAEKLLSLLREYESRWPEEDGTIARVRALAIEYAECFNRTCMPGHITGSAWVLSPDRKRCLLVHHRKLERWLQPGGHADGDQDVLRVAIREACEESGLAHVFTLMEDCPLDVDVHRIPARRDASGKVTEHEHEHHDIRFLLATDEATALAVSEESHEVRWCTPAEVEQLTQEQSVLRLLRKSRRWMNA